MKVKPLHSYTHLDYICFPKYGKLTKHYYNQTHSSEREYVEFDEGKTIKIFLCAPFAEILPRSSNKKIHPQQPLLGKELNNFESRCARILFLLFFKTII